ncbi:hypothetical protein AB9F26_01055 [Falsihalocynthiibacter sp. BN13B15]|uniref:hypothetical protein n=1 Tax=Falsihalocynthiibacter sp. BN13B15 TaxID=3240871 RepID=UPI003510784A
MLELISLIENSSQTVRSDFRNWFKDVPVASNWTLASDYSVGNKNKKSDAFSFVVILRHDTDQNIESYISSVAPKDIKSTRNPSEGLLDYLCCPVTFSYSFVVERQSNYLKNAMTVDVMKSISAQLQNTVREWKAAEPRNEKYYSDFDKKLNLLLEELSSKRPSTSLLRRIFLVSSFAAVVLSLIHEEKAPMSIRWISDRDAMFDRHEGLAFDLTWLLFQLMRRRKGGAIDVLRPQISFAAPLMDGHTEYAEFIRLPDYLAGTLADIRLPQVMFSHRKFPPVFDRLFLTL